VQVNYKINNINKYTSHRKEKSSILKLAFTYKDKLQSTFQNIVFQNKFKFYNYSNYWDCNLKLSEDSWNDIELVSVDNQDNVIGFFRASIIRTSEKVSSLGIVNFYDKNLTFSRDLYQFLKELFEKYNFRKIEFNVVIGNPIEKMYDKYIDKYGGRIIGVSSKSTRLHDGIYYDVKHYEIFRKDYLKNRK